MMARFSIVTFILVIAVLVASVAGDDEEDQLQTFFPNCEVDDFYANLTSEYGSNPVTWPVDELVALVETNHRQIIPRDQLHEVLILLDAAPDSETQIKLLYSNETSPKLPFGSTETWVIERLWPQERGAVGTVAFTDVHNARPTAYREHLVRGGLFYGECGTVEFGDVCQRPASSQSGSDTETDGKIWKPPAHVLGDIARALFYMQLRYENSDLKLRLSDCGPFAGNMGYKSILLEWAAMDPPDEDEITRNDRACGEFQGNRNPFVDYPELVGYLYGEPDQIAPRSRTYEACVDVPTPTPTTSPNECSLVQPGDAMFYIVQSDDPDEVGFVALTTFHEGLELFMTDNAWTGTNFLSREGVVKLRLPEGGIPENTPFGFGPTYGQTTLWETWEGVFNIGTSGDSIFLYCLLNDGTPKPIAGFTNNGEWSEPGLSADEYGAEGSALPDSLKDVGSIALPHYDNYEYIGPSDQVPKAELQEYMMDPENWRGRDFCTGCSRAANSILSISTILVASAIVTFLL